MQQSQLIPHLFRTEFRKITAVLCKSFGIENVTVAEDIASETFLAAMEVWPYKGVPPNPAAWLYTVARNKAKNSLLRDKVFAEKVCPALAISDTVDTFQLDLTPQNIADSQLQMLFAICHPILNVEAQVGLALRILGGFGIDELATAFLSSKETINKRLYRAKEKLRANHVAIEFPHQDEVVKRVPAVLTTIYLLFNEGYYSESNDLILRKDLCYEAMRLAEMLLAYPPTDLPQVHALLALMCFHASRFEARLGNNGELILYEEQDEALWDRKLVSKGSKHLHKASTGAQLSRYHLEAGIAYWHTVKEDTATKWENILLLFDHLLALQYSPIAALNRTYALAKVRGNEVGIAAAEKLQLNDDPFYYALLGELYRTTDTTLSRHNFTMALGLAKTNADRQQLNKKLCMLDAPVASD